MATLSGVKSAIRTGLASHLGLSASKIVPVNDLGPVPQKPFIQYGFFSMRKHPGRLDGFNPPSVADTAYKPDDAVLSTGTTTEARPLYLFDAAADFVTDDIKQFYHVKNVTTGDTTVTLRRLDSQSLLLRNDIFPTIGDSYEVRFLKQRKYYDKPQLQGLALTFIETTAEKADDMADSALEWFLLPTKANAALLALGWRVVDPGAVIVTDFIQQRQDKAFARDLTVTLKGNEVIFEDVQTISTIDLTVDGQHGGIGDQTDLLDRVPNPVEVPST